MKRMLAYNSDGTPALILRIGVFRRHYYHVVPGVGLVELKKEQL